MVAGAFFRLVGERGGPESFLLSEICDAYDDRSDAQHAEILPSPGERVSLIIEGEFTLQAVRRIEDGYAEQRGPISGQAEVGDGDVPARAIGGAKVH